MALIKYINRLRYIDFMIRRRATGCLEKFADKNGLSKRAMTDVLCEMKELGFPIKFDRYKNTYYYVESGEMVKTLFIKHSQILSREQQAMIENDDLCFSEETIFEACKN